MILNFIERFLGKPEPKKKKTVKKAQRLVTLRQITEMHPGFTSGRLRWLKEANPGFRKCTRKIGKRIYVDEHAFNAWLDKQETVK